MHNNALFTTQLLRHSQAERRLTLGSLLLLSLFLGACQENVKPSNEQLSASPNLPRWKELVAEANQAAKRKQWDDAAQTCNEALNLINDTQRTPQTPSETEIREVMALCDQTQLLAGNFGGGRTRSLANCDNLLRGTTRGIAVRQHLVPIQFDKNKTTISEAGHSTATQLATCLKQRGVTKFKVVGHTDMKGSDEINDRISLQRAKSVEDFLKKDGIQAEIISEGHGKKQPLRVENPQNYSEEEIDAMNRRVEVIME